MGLRKYKLSVSSKRVSEFPRGRFLGRRFVFRKTNAPTLADEQLRTNTFELDPETGPGERVYHDGVKPMAPLLDDAINGETAKRRD